MSKRPLTQLEFEHMAQYLERYYWSLSDLKLIVEQLDSRIIAYEENDDPITRIRILTDEESFCEPTASSRYSALEIVIRRRLEQLVDLHDLLRDYFIEPAFFNWFAGKGQTGLSFNKAVTMGSGPLSEEDFDTLLQEYGIEEYHYSSELEVLVVGREDWNSELLMTQIDLRTNMRLKVYSQEMVFAYLACGKDPFDSPSILRFFGNEHPVLQYLMSLGFDWPSTYVGQSSFHLSEIGWPKEGLLKHMGYRVGRAAPSESQRRATLLQVYQQKQLPSVVSRAYIESWGEPNSAIRLKKIAGSLAAFVRMAKQRDQKRLELSISQWEADLEWLRNSVYSGRHRFVWPSTFLGKR